MNDAELAAITAQTQRANQAWVEGEWNEGFGELITASEDASIYGPFGGPLAIGASTWAARGAQVVKQFSNGTSKLHVLAHHQSGDLLVLVTLEEQSTDIAGRIGQPWSLRVTQVYRREAGAWKVVHRHADPLVRRRALDESLALATPP